MRRTGKIRHDENTRDKIKVAMLINRLQGLIEGSIQLSVGQVRAIEVLLRKKLPDLAAIEHTGDAVNVYVARMPEPVKDMAAWREQHMGEAQLAKDVAAIGHPLDTKPTNH